MIGDGADRKRQCIQKAIQAINQGHHNFNFPSFPLVSLLLYYLDDPPALEHGGSHLNFVPFVCPALIKPA